MKNLFKAIRPLAGAAAFALCASTAGAATYHMTILSGEHYAGEPWGETTTDLAGRTFDFTVSDNFEMVTIDYGHGFYEDELVKTMTVTSADIPKFNYLFKFYSKDGINFEREYAGASVGSTFSGEAVLNGQQLQFHTYSSSVNGTYSTDFIAAVPIPGALWLFGSSLLALGIRRRMARAA